MVDHGVTKISLPPLPLIEGAAELCQKNIFPTTRSNDILRKMGNKNSKTFCNSLSSACTLQKAPRDDLI